MYTEKLKVLISPSFDENTLHEILRRSSGCKQVIINNVIIGDSSLTKGYSFLSSVIKFTIEGTVREGHNNDKKVEYAVIVKTLPKNIGRRLSFRSADFFRNETIFYNDIWSALTKFQDSKNIKNKFNSIPLCLTALADGKNDFIALEDLTAQNYGHFKKENELSYESVLFIIRLFARFHALSFAFKDQFPKEFDELVDKIEETYFDEKYRKWYAHFFKDLIACSRDAVEKELPENYLKKFDEFVGQDLYGQLIKWCSDRKNKFSVVTQGDSWIPNFLVKYGDNNELKDIKLIDFQLARCCSATCDISFFLYTCASYELLNEHWDNIIVEYHKAFTAFLTELGSDPSIFNLDEFKDDVQKTAIVGLTISMEPIPFQLMDESETPDLDLIQGDNIVPIHSIWIVKPIKDQVKRQKLANIFKHAIDKGFL